MRELEILFHYKLEDDKDNKHLLIVKNNNVFAFRTQEYKVIGKDIVFSIYKANHIEDISILQVTVADIVEKDSINSIIGEKLVLDCKYVLN